MMTKARVLLVLACAYLAPLMRPGNIRPELKDGVISYMTEDGKKKSIGIGAPCADLWVAPDESVLAFISIDRSRGLDLDGTPFVVTSSLYIARKNEDFAPTRLALNTVRTYDQDWQVFRKPKVLPDGETVTFSVPVSITSGEVFAYHLKTGAVTKVGGSIDYCVVWNGEQAGTILMQRRRLIDLELEYSCYARPPRGDEVRVAEKCEDFKTFLHDWTRIHGGTCN